MNKLFKRIILEDIDAFNYLDPNCFKPKDKKKKNDDSKLRPECENDHEKEKDKEASDDELKPVSKSKRNATDLRRYLQYSNAKNE